MTRETAIEWLDDIKNITENWSQEVAIDMAIEALKAPTESTNTPTNTPTDLISRQDAIEAIATVTMSIHLSNVLCDKLLALPSADTDRSTRLTNAEWKDFLSESFGISKSSAREMLHGMMSVKREDNFKKRFNQRRGERREP